MPPESSATRPRRRRPPPCKRCAALARRRTCRSSLRFVVLRAGDLAQIKAGEGFRLCSFGDDRAHDIVEFFGVPVPPYRPPLLDTRISDEIAHRPQRTMSDLIAY